MELHHPPEVANGQSILASRLSPVRHEVIDDFLHVLAGKGNLAEYNISGI
jgi:hypothetical protein